MKRRDWDHLGKTTAHSLRDLEQVAQLAAESPTPAISIAGQALADDLASIERWTAYLARVLVGAPASADQEVDR